MKALEKWLARPIMQRVVYLLALLLWLFIHHSNGSFNKLLAAKTLKEATAAIVFVPVLLLGAQVVWNKQWLWRLLCAVLICFTLWLATLSLPDIISGAGTSARSVVWGVGVIGFTILLVLVLAFLNWMLLHMKPKK